MVWGLSQRGAAPTAERRGARLWWWGLSQRGAAPTGERRCARLLLCGPFAAPRLRTARNARPQAAINRRRKEVSGGSNTQHQAPPGQSSRTDTISGFEEERANRKF